MAKTISANGAKGHHKFTLTVTEDSTSTSGNTSSLSYTFKISPVYTTWDWRQWGESISYSVTINGKSYTGYIPAYDGSSTVTLKSGSGISVAHNSDGSKSINISFSVVDNANQRYTCGNASASATMTLTTIPRASSITSAGNVTLGNACSIKWTPASNSFKYKLKFSLSSWSHTTGYITPNTTSAYTYTGYSIPASDDLYNLIPNSATGTMSVTLTTYNSSGTKIGSTSAEKTFTVTIPSSIKPSLGTISIDPVNITTKDGTSRNILVKGKNKITVSISGCKAGTGSSIKNYTFAVLSGSTVISTTTTTNTSVTFGPFSQTGSLKFRVTVTDNRSRSVNNSGSEPTQTCYDYSAPSLGGFDAYRANSDGTSNMNGTYIKCVYTPKYASVNSTNNATVTAYYNGKSQTGSNGTVLINLNGDQSTTYNVYLSIIDNYNGTDKTSTITIFGQARILNITSDGTGVAIGKMAESSELLECRWPAKFNDNLTVGMSTQVSAPTGGITVHDVRDATITPESFGDKNANFYFDTNDSDGRWYSIMHMKGWSGSTYAAWELAGNAHNNANDNTLKYRQGVGATWGDWQTVVTNKNINNYVGGSYLPLKGGTLTGGLTLPNNLYYASDKFGLNCENSDIIGINAMYFNDASDSAGEGINFNQGTEIWDTIYAKNGVLKFHPNRSTSTNLGGYIVYNSSNFRRGVCTLNCSTATTVTFSSAMGGSPTVMLTPLTTTGGVIAGKVRSATSTGFEAIIGGSEISGDVKFAYLAVYY